MIRYGTFKEAFKALRIPQMLSRAQTAVRVARQVGFSTALAEMRARAFGHATFPAALRSARGNVRLRPHTTDRTVYVKVLVEREYDYVPAQQPLTIIDAGANIGLSAAFFASRFPGSRVIAVEPERSNFELLCANVRTFPNVLPIRAALWSTDGFLSVADPGIGAWGYRVSPAPGDDSVPALSVDSLMRQFGLDRIDLLKIDIEGAEREVFSAPRAWIDSVATIIAELHDRYAPGCSRAFFRATDSFDWEWFRGENVFVSRAHVFGNEPPRGAQRILRTRSEA